MEEKQRIPQHRHCRRCGRAFAGEGYRDRYCSEECFAADGTEAKGKLRKYAVITGVLWIVVIATVLLVGFR